MQALRDEKLAAMGAFLRDYEAEHGEITDAEIHTAVRDARARAVEVAPLDDTLGRRAGTLLRRTHTSDVHDAALVLLACDGEVILSSDPGDLSALATACGVHVDLTRA